MKIWSNTNTFAKDEIAQYKNALYISLVSSNTNHLPDATGSTYWAIHNDPITQVYNALWSLLESHTPLASMVKSGNKIKFTGSDRSPEKEQTSTDDYPEIRIVPTDTTPHLQHTSNGSSILKSFRIEVATGDQRIDAGLFAIEWEIYRALVNWQTTLSALKWNDKAYAKLARPKAVKDGLMRQSDLERGIKCWVSIWECEVEMWFSTADMILTEN